METYVNENVIDESSDFEKVKKHWAKHKNKYIIGGFLGLAFGLGFHFGNKGNSRHVYSRLLKDGVRDAVEEGIRDVVENGMHDVVQDGMQYVVKDVVTNVVKTNVKNAVEDAVKNTVGSAVRNAIKESAVTIIKGVSAVEPKPIKNKDVDDLNKALNFVLYDDDGTAYAFKYNA